MKLMVVASSSTTIRRRIQTPGLSQVFTPEEIEDARREGSLLSLDIELTKLCNFRCVYCYAAPGERQENELTLGELLSVIDDAKKAGLKTLTLTGGEPLLDEKYFTAARYARERNIAVLLFTNGSLISREVAERLMELNVSPCVKLDSLSEGVQDRMAGVVGAYQQIMSGIENLTAVGFTTNYPVLAINATACRENVDDLPGLWTWARSHGISPSLTRLQRMGRARERADLMLSASELRGLFRALSDTDRYYGYLWDPVIPWHSGKACRRHYIGCFIGAEGNVQPCSGVPLVAGNIRERGLREIVATAEIFKTARQIERKVEGACSNCAHNAECYGCRSIAYFSGKGFTGADPLCWHNMEAM